MNRRDLYKLSLFCVAMLAVSPIRATETYTTAAATSSTGLGTPNVAYATSASTGFASFGTAFGAAVTAPISQLASTATAVAYASSSTTDQFTAYATSSAFGAPVGAAASSSFAGPIQSYANSASTSTVTGYTPNVASYASFGSAFGAPVGGYAITLTSPLPGLGPTSFILSEDPEPSTWMLFGTALVALWFVRRRQLQAKA